MILPELNSVVGPDEEIQLIVEWRVFYQTPRGLVYTLSAAVRIYEELGLPYEGIRYVAVAIGKNGHYEVLS